MEARSKKAFQNIIHVDARDERWYQSQSRHLVRFCEKNIWTRDQRKLSRWFIERWSICWDCFGDGWDDQADDPVTPNLAIDAAIVDRSHWRSDDKNLLDQRSRCSHKYQRARLCCRLIILWTICGDKADDRNPISYHHLKSRWSNLTTIKIYPISRMDDNMLPH